MLYYERATVFFSTLLIVFIDIISVHATERYHSSDHTNACSGTEDGYYACVLLPRRSDNNDDLAIIKSLVIYRSFSISFFLLLFLFLQPRHARPVGRDAETSNIELGSKRVEGEAEAEDFTEYELGD